MNKHIETTSEGSTQPELTAAEIVEEARQRVEAKQSLPEKTQPALSSKQENTVRWLNHAVFWLSKHWLALFNLLNGLYISGTFLAPILMQAGQLNAAALIYKFYKPFCHQYPVRSWFLLGSRIVAYSSTSGILDADLHHASEFVGNAALGYKVAFCQRDVAIYGSIFLAGLLFGLIRNKWRLPPLPWWAYIAFGIAPMGLDGGYQLISQIIGGINPAWILPRESTPLLRTVTGALFGTTTIAFIYPYIHDFFEETKNLLATRYGWR